MWTINPSEGDKRRMAFVIRHLERVAAADGHMGPVTEEWVLRLALLDFALELSHEVHGEDDGCVGK